MVLCSCIFNMRQEYWFTLIYIDSLHCSWVVSPLQLLSVKKKKSHHQAKSFGVLTGRHEQEGYPHFWFQGCLCGLRSRHCWGVTRKQIITFIPPQKNLWSYATEGTVLEPESQEPLLKKWENPVCFVFSRSTPPRKCKFKMHKTASIFRSMHC